MTYDDWRATEPDYRTGWERSSSYNVRDAHTGENLAGYASSDLVREVACSSTGRVYARKTEQSAWVPCSEYGIAAREVTVY